MTESNLEKLNPVIEEPVDIPPSMPSVYSNMQTFEEGQRMARALAEAKLVPEAFRNNIPNALIALELAQRLKTSPLVVMQNLYVVHGKPAWSSQYLIAVWNAANPLAKMRFKLDGSGDDRSCIAYAVNEMTGEVLEGPAISIKTAKDEGWFGKNGSKWKTLPDLMLRYRAATFFVRTNAPELTAGIQTNEEIRDTYDARKGSDGTFTTAAENLNQKLNQEAG